MSSIEVKRKCSRCSAIEGELHPISLETTILEKFLNPNKTMRLVCRRCATHLEARATKNKRRDKGMGSFGKKLMTSFFGK